VNVRLKIVLVTGVLLSALAFFAGRTVEERAVARKARSLNHPAALPTATVKVKMATYRELAAADIIALPFAEFYEALRSAPAEAREKWRADLERMPAGPRRNAAVAGFYKLLVQFDPVSAAKDVCKIDDKDLRSLALKSLVGAAPGFALKDVATILLNDPADAPDYQNLYEIMSQWNTVDPAAVAKFCDEHPDAADRGNKGDLVKAWAAIDPQAAHDWLTANRYGIGILGDFVMGWYLNDHAAAIDFAVAHAEDLVPSAGLGTLFSALYLDSKEDAKKFIERLPNDELRQSAFRGCELAVQFGTAEETGEPERMPRAIADWTVQFPPRYWREHLSEVLGYWDAPQEVFSWIEQQPTEIQDAVAAEYRLVRTEDTVKTVTAVFQFARPDLQDRLLAAMFHNAGGSAWQVAEEIKKSSLPTEQRQRVLEIASKVEKDEAAAREESARAENDQGNEK
jgi:hypothetical protein